MIHCSKRSSEKIRDVKKPIDEREVIFEVRRAQVERINAINDFLIDLLVRTRNHATGRHKCLLRGDEHEWPCDGIYQGFMTPANHLSIRAQWSENRGPLHNVLFVGADSIVSQPSGVLNPIFAP